MTWMRGNSDRFAFALWHCGLVSAAAAVLLVAVFTIGYAPPAEALPSYARQTGQPCGTCHTDFAGLHPLRPSFQDQRLHDWRRSVSHNTVPQLRRCRQERAKALGAAALDDDGRRIYQHAGAAATADRAIQCKQQHRGVSVSFLWGGAITDHIGAFAQVTTMRHPPEGLARDPFGRSWTWDNTDVRFADSDADRRLQRHLRHYRQQQSDRPGSLEHHAGVVVPYVSSNFGSRIWTDPIIDGGFAATCGERRRLHVHQRCALP